MSRVIANCPYNIITYKMCMKLTLIKVNRNRVIIAGYRVVGSNQPQRNGAHLPTTKQQMKIICLLCEDK